MLGECNRDDSFGWGRTNQNWLRSWLRTADEAKKVQQIQLRLVLDNISLPVSRNPSMCEAIIESLTNALEALNDLVQGKALRIQSGEVLLGLSSWHLYPDMSVLGNDAYHHIPLKDPLITPGGVITIGLQNRSPNADDGIYWSLPLATMRFYGHPVLSTGRVGLRDSQVTFHQFLCVVLGSIIQSWGWTKQDITIPLELLATLDWRDSSAYKSILVPNWLSMLLNTAKRYRAAFGPEKIK